MDVSRSVRVRIDGATPGKSGLAGYPSKLGDRESLNVEGYPAYPLPGSAASSRTPSPTGGVAKEAVLEAATDAGVPQCAKVDR